MSASASRRSSISTSVSSGQTARADAEVAPAGKTARRWASVRSFSSSRSQLHSTTARNVRCRGIAVRLPPVSSRKRSSILAAIVATGSTRSRAAASSIASGRPSSRRTISTTAPTVASSTTKPALAAAARSAKSWTDADGHRLRRRGVDRRQSKRRDCAERLTGDVERLPTRGEDPDPRASGEQIVDQLRRSRDHVLAVVDDEQDIGLGEGGEQAAGRVGVEAVGGTLEQLGDRGCRGRTRTACSTPSGSVTGASSTNHTPSSTRSTQPAAISFASRVLPAPPGPTSVVRRPAFEHGVDPVDLVAASHEAAHRGPQVVPRRRRRVGIRHPSVP